MFLGWNETEYCFLLINECYEKVYLMSYAFTEDSEQTSLNKTQNFNRSLKLRPLLL